MSKSKSIYQKKLEELLQNVSENKIRPRLLMHACCGPCSSYVLEYLTKYFDITIFYYNPNIYPQEEYERRLNELKVFYTKFPAAKNIIIIEETYNPEDFYTAIDVRNHQERATEPEKGERCGLCYKFRLEKAFEYAKENKFDYFCTTLSISPFKDAEKINTIGLDLENQLKMQTESPSQSQIPSQSQETEFSIKWLPSDFKKNGGFKRSLELSSEYGLYRQQYCGCVYSMRNRP